MGLRRVLILLILSWFVVDVMGQAPSGIWRREGSAHYIGDLEFAPLDDGRHMRIVKPFGFVDSSGRKWVVPAGAIVDGASIPQMFWSVTGGPFEGKYRNASVVHDYYCDVRTRSWRNTDRVFHEAMLASGVSEREAKVMYMAVVYGGPHWDSQTVRNNILSSTNAIVVASEELHVTPDRGLSENPSDMAIALEQPEQRQSLDRAKAISLEKTVRETNPTLDQIDKLVSEASER